jgi:hypothetical protein
VTALFIVLFFLNGEPMVQGTVFRTQEECIVAVEKIPTIIAEFNHSAENPIKITHFVAGCAPMQKAPQGKAL